MNLTLFTNREKLYKQIFYYMIGVSINYNSFHIHIEPA